MAETKISSEIVEKPQITEEFKIVGCRGYGKHEQIWSVTEVEETVEPEGGAFYG